MERTRGPMDKNRIGGAADGLIRAAGEEAEQAAVAREETAERLDPGDHVEELRIADFTPRRATSGVYFYTMRAWGAWAANAALSSSKIRAR